MNLNNEGSLLSLRESSYRKSTDNKSRHKSIIDNNNTFLYYLIFLVLIPAVQHSSFVRAFQHSVLLIECSTFIESKIMNCLTTALDLSDIVAEKDDDDDVISSSFPYSFTPVPDSLDRPFADHFPAYSGGLFRCSDGTRFVLSPDYASGAEKLYNFRPKRGDCWVVTFPRSGMTSSFVYCT